MDSLVHTLLNNALAATFMAVIVLVLSRICRRPALTHSLWLLVMLKLIMPPFLPVSFPVAKLIPPIKFSVTRSVIVHDTGLASRAEVMPYLDTDESGWRDLDEITSGSRATSLEIAPDFAEAVGKPQPDNLSTKERPLPSGPTSGWSWEPLVLVAILTGALGWWTLATARIIRFQRLLKDVRPASGEWQLHTDDLSEQIGLGWRPSVYLMPGRVPPMLWAIGGRPRLLVPSELWTDFALAS
jgi:bla regulator protein blaR1